MTTKIIVPDSLTCVCCGDAGLPVASGGSFRYVGVMHRPTDGSPCFCGPTFGVCSNCYDLAYLEMEGLLTPWQRIRVAVAQFLRPVEPLSRVWFAMASEQREAWVRAVESVATADLSDPLGKEVR